MSDLPAAPPVPAPVRPPGRRRAVRVVAVALGSVAALALASLSVWGFVVYATHDRLELIEDDALLDAVAAPCAALTEAAAQVGTAEGADALAATADAMRDVAAAVRAQPREVLDGDRPAADWATDWGRYADALDAAVVSGVIRTPQTDDGYRVVDRMDLAAPEGCSVPPVVVGLDPAPPPAGG